MAKQNLLLVDADLRSLRVLEVSLRKAGYSVASTGNASDALAMLELSRPDLVLCDTRLPTMDGFELIQEIRRRPELADIPLMILSSDVSVETKVRGLELGVEDYLTKPIYIKELLARVNITLQRKRREGMEHLDHGNKRRFSGSLSDMGVVDLLQAIDHNKKSGVLYLTSGNFDGAIYFCNGAPVDAAVGSLQSSRAIYRTLLWTDGTFEVDFREIDREDHVQASMQAVLMEGLRRVDEWGRLLEQLPDLDTVFDVSDTQLIARLAEIPDEINSVLREFDGERSLWQIVDACHEDDIETLNAVSKLYFEGLLYNTGRQASTPAASARGAESMPELGDIVLPHISSGPPLITHTLAPAWPSVPIGSDPARSYALDDDTLQLNIPANARLPEGLGRTIGHAPKRRKQRKRKKRSGRSLAPAAERKQPAAPARPEAEQVLEVDESCAEITPSTIAPPPEDAAIAEILQADRAQAAVPTPAFSKPPKLPGSKPASALPSDDHPTVELTPLRNAATPPPLRNLTHPPLDAAANEVDAEATMRSTAPPPASANPESMFAQSDSPQAPLNATSAFPRANSSLSPSSETNISRRPGTPPPLPFVSKPPPEAEPALRGFTIPPLATASADTFPPASADAETKPPPSTAASPTLTDALIAAASQPPLSDEAHLPLATASDFPANTEVATISPSAAPNAQAVSALPETTPPRAADVPTASQAAPPPLATTHHPATRDSGLPVSDDETSSPLAAASMPELRAASDPPIDHKSAAERSSTAPHSEAETNAPPAAASRSPAGASSPPFDTEDSQLDSETSSLLAAASRSPSGMIAPPQVAAAQPPDMESPEDLASVASSNDEADSQPPAPSRAARGSTAPHQIDVASNLPAELHSATASEDEADSLLPAASLAPDGFTAPPPLAAASAPPSVDDDAESQLTAASRAPRDLTSLPELATASAPPTELEGQFVEASALPSDMQSVEDLASAISPDAETGSQLPAASQAPRAFTSPPQFAGHSNAPAEPSDSEHPSSAAASDDDADSSLAAASRAPRDLTSPPQLTAASAAPPESEGQSADVSAQPSDMENPEDLASATASDAKADPQLSAADRAAREFTSPPQLARASNAPADIERSERSATPADDEVASPLAAASQAPRDLSSAPELAAASAPPTELEGQFAEVSVLPTDMKSAEDLASQELSATSTSEDDADSPIAAAASQAPHRFSSPPQFAAASVPPADIDSLEAFGSSADSGEASESQLPAASRAPRYLSSPPQFAATSAPPAEDASLPPRDFSSPPLAAPSDMAGSGVFRSVVPPAEEEEAPSAASMSDQPSESEIERLAALTSSISYGSDESSSQPTSDSMPARDFTSPALATASEPPPDPERWAGSALPPSAAEASLRPGFSGAPPLAAASNAPPDEQSDAGRGFHAPPLATVTYPPTDADPTQGATSGAPQQSGKRMRPPLLRTATPPAFNADMAPPLPAAADASSSTGAEPGNTTNSAAPEAGAAGAPSAPLDSTTGSPVREALAKVISFVPRKRASDSAARASSRAPASERPKSGSPSSTKPGSLAAPSPRSLTAKGASRDAWSSTSGAPSQTAGPDTSGAPSQAAPQAKRHISRWLQAGGVAATLALAAGLFALRARDAAPQGSLITAVPETLAPQEIPPPTAAPGAQARAVDAELDALQKTAPAAAPAQASKDNLPKSQPAVEAAKPQASPNAAVAAPADKTKPSTPTGAAPAQVAKSAPISESAPKSPPAAATSQPPAAQSESSPGAQASTAQALTKGRSLEQKGKIQDALALYTKAIEAGGASSELLSRMAFVYLNQRKNTLAEAHAKRAVDADETNSEAWIILGAAQDQLGKKQAAQDAYRNCASKGQGQYVVECKRMLR